MAHGFNGKILVVDLTAGTHEIKEPGERWYRTYFGGTGIIAETLLTEDISGVDPLGPENVLILACSVVTGAPISGFNRFSVGAKSPLTGGFAVLALGGRHQRMGRIHALDIQVAGPQLQPDHAGYTGLG